MFMVHSLINDNNIDDVMVFTVSLLSKECKEQRLIGSNEDIKWPSEAACLHVDWCFNELTL
jgi:hypothetical protein